MKILNLYAGIGGNIELIDDTKHEITNVEIEPEIAEILQKRKPNQKVIITDAHQYLLDHADEYDFIWSSFPCQSHTRMMKATRHKIKRYPEMGLYQEIIFLGHFFKGLYVAENVIPYYEPLIKPTITLGRHLFWSNFLITPFHKEQPKNFIQDDTVEGCQRLKDWLGIQYEGNIYYKNNHSPGQVLRNCVHPETGLHILNCALGKYTSLQTKQQTLFQ